MHVFKYAFVRVCLLLSYESRGLPRAQFLTHTRTHTHTCTHAQMQHTYNRLPEGVAAQFRCNIPFASAYTQPHTHPDRQKSRQTHTDANPDTDMDTDIISVLVNPDWPHSDSIRVHFRVRVRVCVCMSVNPRVAVNPSVARRGSERSARRRCRTHVSGVRDARLAVHLAHLFSHASLSLSLS